MCVFATLIPVYCKCYTLSYGLLVQASTYATPVGSRATTPGLAANPTHPKVEPKQERAATPPAHMGSHMGSVNTEPKQERGRTPPSSYGAAAAQAGSHAASGVAAGEVSGQQGGGALPQGAAGGPAGPGPSPRVSPYFSRRSPSPLPMRHSGEMASRHTCVSACYTTVL